VNPRHAFYKVVAPRFPYLAKLGLYNEALSNLGEPSKSLFHASDEYHANPTGIAEIFLETRLKRINNSTKMHQHQNLDEATTLFSAHLTDLTNSQLDVLTFYASTYEQFTLVTLEPYMIFILGNTLFFKLFVPLHREGACSVFVKMSVKRQKDLRKSFYLYHNNNITDHMPRRGTSTTFFNEKYLY
jgi:hypothetical protein